jgi:proliferating cell nuclear antigen
LKLIFENPLHERRSEFCINLISIDIEHLAIPETEYSSLVSLSSSEFSKICRELYQLNETLSIKTMPGFVQFSVESDAGSGSIKLGKNDGMTAECKTNIEVDDEDGVTQ